MANPEHLEILKQGVEAWNKWREYNSNIIPDLSRAYLQNAHLIYANLEKANLFEIDLAGANINFANLSGANLNKAQMSGSKLFGSNLQSVNMQSAILVGTIACGSNMKRSELSSACFYMSDLTEANLEESDLKNVDLRNCGLTFVNLTGAILTGAKLYGTSRDDWKIKDVECEYVYWDFSGKQRSPKDRDLEPGEFERLYAALPTIEYIFENGMTPIDPLIMDRVVQAIRGRQPEFDIKIDSINARGLAPSIKFTVQHEEHKETALEEVRKGYEDRISRLEDEKIHLYNLLSQAIDKAGGVKLITAGPGAIVATDGSTINIQQHIHNTLELQKAIAAEPEESKSFAKVAKKTALDIIGESIKDIAKGQVKEAAKQIIELGKDLGPIIVKTAAYAFFKGIGG